MTQKVKVYWERGYNSWETKLLSSVPFDQLQYIDAKDIFEIDAPMTLEPTPEQLARKKAWQDRLAKLAGK